NTISRRQALATVCAGVSAMLVAAVRASAQAKPALMVYKDRQCGCCSGWVDHMRAGGFTASVLDSDMTAIHAQQKIPASLQSCHTALVGGYVIEGHVPAADVKSLLARKPQGIRGLTIPGMPASAPGMDQLPFQPYTVLTFDAQGKTAVFAKPDRP